MDGNSPGFYLRGGGFDSLSQFCDLKFSVWRMTTQEIKNTPPTGLSQIFVAR
jgi:hypothetical protein